MIPWYENAFGNYVAGIVLSLGDRTFSDNAARKTEERVTKKLEQIESLKYLAEADQRENRSEIQTTTEYQGNIAKASEYFKDRKISLSDKKPNIAKRLVDRVAFYKNNERINNLSWKQSLATAFGIELTLDSTVVLSQALSGVGNGMAAIGHSCYQFPALWAGFMTGKGVLYVKDKLCRSKEEKGLDEIGESLTSDGKLLSLIKNYSATQNMQFYEQPKIEETQRKKIESVEVIGKKIGENIVNTAEKTYESVAASFDEIKQKIMQKRADKQAKIEAEKAAKREKFQKTLDNY